MGYIDACARGKRCKLSQCACVDLEEPSRESVWMTFQAGEASSSIIMSRAMMLHEAHFRKKKKNKEDDEE